MTQTVEVSPDAADLITEQPTVLRRFVRDGELVVELSLPQVDDEPITARVLARIIRFHRRMWGKRGPGEDDN